jgi:(1->4)-alpha-D-glucan 1-alpha-D-glucosylmutase
LKLFVTYKALNFRRDHLDLFLHGDYLPLSAAGEREQHLVALARRRDSLWALAVAGRFFSKLAPPGELPVGEKVWGETALLLPEEAPSEWTNIFTADTVSTLAGPQGPALPLSQVLGHLPVALLFGHSP